MVEDSKITAPAICRGQTVKYDIVLKLVEVMPRHSMNRKEFTDIQEAKFPGWGTTHSQVARQLGLYYENNDICYPRFTHDVSVAEVIVYAVNWATKYFAPNPYTKDLKRLYQGQPKNLYLSLKQAILQGNTDFESVCDNLFEGIEILNNKDKVKAYITAFTDIAIENGLMSLREGFDDRLQTVAEMNRDFTESEYFHYFDMENNNSKNILMPSKQSLQQIYYGAPGTGKSHKTDEVAALYDDTVRTTFHPDSDYSTFVGAYKPTMVSDRRYEVVEGKAKSLQYHNDEEKKGFVSDNKIEYKFVKQAFLKAYVRAWKKFVGMEEVGEVAPQFLVIEEINRGNCAQIFGDLFQLLDRKQGFSEYPIEADEDIKNALLEDNEDSFGPEGLKLSDEWKNTINATIGKGSDVANKIAKGKVLVLPCNLYIWATMNTSDQSLFPIDSAFKRRWDWKYMRIKDAGKEWTVNVKYTDKEGAEHESLDWWEFLEAINEQIYQTTKSEDKQLGYFFCKATEKAKETDEEATIITPETFVGKVIFYLWQDVFKATGFRSDIFKYKKNDRDCIIKFHDFYNGETDEATNPEGIDKELLATFVANVMKAL